MIDRQTLTLQKIQSIKSSIEQITALLKKLLDSHLFLYQQLHDINTKLDLIANREFLADSLKERVEKIEQRLPS